MRIAHNEPVSGMTIRGEFDDAIRIYADDSVSEDNRIIDDYKPELFNKAHRDGIQLIPRGKHNAQYAAAMLSNVTIRNNRIQSGNKLQGIFSSDGLLKSITITGNTIDTLGQHYITLSGVLSGLIEGNRKSNGSLCPVVLEPLRIGGNPGMGNLYVIGFCDLAYEPLPNVVTDSTLEHVTDNRFGHATPRKYDQYLDNFDLAAYQKAANNYELGAVQMRALAISFGSLLT